MKHITGYFLFLLSTATIANEADVIDVKTQCDGECTFYVTVAHQDEGWDHYANRWEVLTPDGDVIATRTLAHPHVSEQPFTRSLSHIKIPAGVKKVVVRAHDSVHGDGGTTFDVEIGINPD
jgi:hypothetical protein